MLRINKKYQSILGLMTCISLLIISFSYFSIGSKALDVTVDSTGNESDNNIGDGTCATALSTCTLRAAIEELNISGNLFGNNINFNLSGSAPFIINVPTPLPVASKYIIINGDTQPGFLDSPVIEINGDGTRTYNGFDDDGLDGRFELYNLAIGGFNYGVTGNTFVNLSYLGLNSDGLTANPNNIGQYVTTLRIFSTNNVISGNISHGIQVVGDGTPGNIVDVTISDNLIGTDSTGSADVGNGGNGIDIQGVNDPDGFVIGYHPIFNNNAGEGRNIISGNGGNGIDVRDSNELRIHGNYIGVGSDGVTPIPNDNYGVSNFGVSEAFIGVDSNTDAQRNIISSNGSDGVWTYNNNDTAINGNYIGTDVTGLIDRGNGRHGVYIDQGAGFSLPTDANNEISDNLVGANNNNGIMIQDLDGYTIHGNVIGLNANQDGVLPNGQFGICFNGSDSNQIGGDSTAGEGNVIAANAGFGINIMTGSTGNIIEGNFIGTNDLNDTNFGNGNNGINIIQGASGNVIGNPSDNPETQNIIRFNNGHGVSIGDNDSGNDEINNAVHANSIYENAGLGVNLEISSGIESIDLFDTDGGPNNGQNFTQLTNLSETATEVTIEGILYSEPNKDYIVDVYANELPFDPNNDREGQLFVGSQTVTTDSNGSANFSVTSLRANIPFYTSLNEINLQQGVDLADVNSVVFTTLASEVNGGVRSNSSEFGWFGVYDLTNNITSSPQGVEVDGVFDFNVDVTNTGTYFLTNGNLEIVFDSELEYVDGSCTASGCSHNNGVLTIPVGDFLLGQNINFDFSASAAEVGDGVAITTSNFTSNEFNLSNSVQNTIGEEITGSGTPGTPVEMTLIRTGGV